MREVVGFHSILTDQHGNVLGNSYDKKGHPKYVLIGSGEILPALEQHLSTMDVGERKSVIISNDQAYGPVDQSLKLKIPRSKFPDGTDIKVGLQFQGGEKDGWPIIFRVTKIDGDDIYADANHELAGLTLHYDIEIMEKREATTEEISHGHAHRRAGTCG